MEIFAYITSTVLWDFLFFYIELFFGKFTLSYRVVEDRSFFVPASQMSP